MEKEIRKCKICGKDYPYCIADAEGSKFRYKDVACCVEHAIEYFKRVAIARGETVEEERVEEKPQARKPRKSTSASKK